MADYQDIKIDEKFLAENPQAWFVFGDNAMRVGNAGAAALRGHPRAIGFVTKKAPNNNPESFFKPDEYVRPFLEQLKQLEAHIQANPDKVFYISRLGAGLANRHHIWEKVIGINLSLAFDEYPNVVLCWDRRETTFQHPLADTLKKTKKSKRKKKVT